MLHIEQYRCNKNPHAIKNKNIIPSFADNTNAVVFLTIWAPFKSTVDKLILYLANVKSGTKKSLNQIVGVHYQLEMCQWE